MSMSKASEMMMALKPDERIRALAYLPGDDLIRALEEKYLYLEWMVDSVRCAVNQPLFPDEDKARGLNLENLTKQEEFQNGKETE